MFRSLLAATAAVLVLCTPAAAIGVDATCVLPITRVDAATLNVAFPDEAAVYWVGAYVPGAKLRIEGRYPAARYFSFNVYDSLLRPVGGLNDAELVPDPGGRSYTAWIVPGAGPAAQNTIRTGASLAGLFIYRVYLPEHGETGGVGLPRVTLELLGATQPLRLLDCTYMSKPTTAGLNEAIAQLSPPPALDVVRYPGANPPRWRKFQNLVASAITVLLNGEPGSVADAGGSGGFLSNRDNAYVSAVVNRAFGQVVAVTGRAPTRAQLRYWSLCQNEFLTQRYIACRTDEQTTVRRDGTYVYAVSTAQQRPANARPECGVTWIPWGPFPEGSLIYRHMLPAKDYAQAIQRAVPGKEAATMGDTLPRARYFSDRRAFERLGCPVRSLAAR